MQQNQFKLLQRNKIQGGYYANSRERNGVGRWGESRGVRSQGGQTSLKRLGTKRARHIINDEDREDIEETLLERKWRDEEEMIEAGMRSFLGMRERDVIEAYETVDYDPIGDRFRSQQALHEKLTRERENREDAISAITYRIESLRGQSSQSQTVYEVLEQYGDSISHDSISHGLYKKKETADHVRDLMMIRERMIYGNLVSRFYVTQRKLA